MADRAWKSEFQMIIAFIWTFCMNENSISVFSIVEIAYFAKYFHALFEIMCVAQTELKEKLPIEGSSRCFKLHNPKLLDLNLNCSVVNTCPALTILLLQFQRKKLQNGNFHLKSTYNHAFSTNFFYPILNDFYWTVFHKIPSLFFIHICIKNCLFCT